MKKICNISKLAMFVTLLLMWFTASTVPVYASANEVFQNLGGDGKYMADGYFYNYYFDTVKANLLDPWIDVAAGGMANLLFFMITQAAYRVVSVFYYAFSLDVAGMFKDQIDFIQSKLNLAVFEPLFYVAYAGASVTILGKLIKRDFAGSLSEVLKVVIILVTAGLVVSNSGSALSAVTYFTKTISVESMMAFSDSKSSDESSMNQFAADAAGTLWGSLVHRPWMAIEFIGNANSDDAVVEKILGNPRGSDERMAEIEKQKDFFPLDLGIMRFGLSFVYLILFIGKSAIYLVVSLMLLATQVMSIFLLFLSPVIMILALLPGYGTRVIGAWARQMLEKQVSMLIMMMFLGFITGISSFFSTQNFGDWLVGMIFEVVICGYIILNHRNILNMMSTGAQFVASPGRVMMGLNKANGNIFSNMERNDTIATGARLGVHTAGETVRRVTSAAYTGAGWVSDTYDKVNAVATYETSNLLYNAGNENLSKVERPKLLYNTSDTVVDARNQEQNTSQGNSEPVPAVKVQEHRTLTLPSVEATGPKPKRTRLMPPPDDESTNTKPGPVYSAPAINPEPAPGVQSQRRTSIQLSDDGITDTATTNKSPKRPQLMPSTGETDVTATSKLPQRTRPQLMPSTGENLTGVEPTKKQPRPLPLPAAADGEAADTKHTDEPPRITGMKLPTIEPKDAPEHAPQVKRAKTYITPNGLISRTTTHFNSEGTKLPEKTQKRATGLNMASTDALERRTESTERPTLDSTALSQLATATEKMVESANQMVTAAEQAAATTEQATLTSVQVPTQEQPKEKEKASTGQSEVHAQRIAEQVSEKVQNSRNLPNFEHSSRGMTATERRETVKAGALGISSSPAMETNDTPEPRKNNSDGKPNLYPAQNEKIADEPQRVTTTTRPASRGATTPMPPIERNELISSRQKFLNSLPEVSKPPTELPDTSNTPSPRSRRTKQNKSDSSL